MICRVSSPTIGTSSRFLLRAREFTSKLLLAISDASHAPMTPVAGMSEGLATMALCRPLFASPGLYFYARHVEEFGDIVDLQDQIGSI